MSQHRRDGLSLILPVRDQAAALERALPAWRNTLDKLDREFEIILIDDGSGEGTKSLLDGSESKKGLLQTVPHLKAIRHDTPRGFGACLRTGLASARHPLVAYTSLEHAYVPDDIKALLHRIEEADPETGQKLDIVSGFRAGKPIEGWDLWWGRFLRLFQRIVLSMPMQPPYGALDPTAKRYARWMRFFFGLRIQDIDSKFKLFRREMLNRFPIQSDGEFVHAEILAKANFLGALMDEIPVAVRPGPFQAQPWPADGISRWNEGKRVFRNPGFTLKIPEVQRLNVPPLSHGERRA